MNPGQGASHQSQASTHHLEGDIKEAECSYNMFVVETDEGPPEPFYATVNVRGLDITFEIDSGAAAQ